MPHERGSLPLLPFQFTCPASADPKFRCWSSPIEPRQRCHPFRQTIDLKTLNTAKRRLPGFSRTRIEPPRCPAFRKFAPDLPGSTILVQDPNQEWTVKDA